MRFYKTDNNEVFAYEDDTGDEYILPDLIAITEEEANAILNPPLTAEQLIALADAEKVRRRAVADSEIAWRQDAVDAGIAMEEEIAELANWRKYRVLLMRVNTENPAWPAIPA